MDNFFLSPILRAPLIGSMLMCLASSLLGVLLFVRKKSLLAESLSHSTYPGVIFGVLCAIACGCEKWLPCFVLFGGFCTALLGAFSIHFLKERMKIREDAALCFVLASFFGVGVTLVSRVQVLFPAHVRSIQGYLYGQASTMSDIHILLYGSFASVILLALFLFYKEFFSLSFDPQFFLVSGLGGKGIDFLLLTLVVLSVVIGSRCVGVVLMSAMLIAPAIAARRLTQRLSTMFIISGLIGLMSAFAGCQISFHVRKTFPTGPVIVLIVSTLAFLTLFFAPGQGLLIRYFRIGGFRLRCIEENLLKALWRRSSLSFAEMSACGIPWLPLLFILVSLRAKKWIKRSEKKFHITPEGHLRAGKIIRLHRLWEVYLVEYLGIKAERVHKSAEEMEHILTPELERDLTKLLGDPLLDPHDQPIPKRSEVYG